MNALEKNHKSSSSVPLYAKNICASLTHYPTGHPFYSPSNKLTSHIHMSGQTKRHFAPRGIGIFHRNHSQYRILIGMGKGGVQTVLEFKTIFGKHKIVFVLIYSLMGVSGLDCKCGLSRKKILQFLCFLKFYSHALLTLVLIF